MMKYGADLGKLKFRGKGQFIIRESNLSKEKYPPNAAQAYSIDINNGTFIQPFRFFLNKNGTIQFLDDCHVAQEFSDLEEMLHRLSGEENIHSK